MSWPCMTLWVCNAGYPRSSHSTLQNCHPILSWLVCQCLPLRIWPPNTSCLGFRARVRIPGAICKRVDMAHSTCSTSQTMWLIMWGVTSEMQHKVRVTFASCKNTFTISTRSLAIWHNMLQKSRRYNYLSLQRSASNYGRKPMPKSKSYRRWGSYFLTSWNLEEKWNWTILYNRCIFERFQLVQ